MSKCHAALLCLLVAVALAAGSAAQVYAPRITSPLNADTSDLGRFRQFHLWKDKQGNDLAFAVWQYLTDHETGVYHFEHVYDGFDSFGEYSSNQNPLKLLNVYNMAICYQFAPCFDGIYDGLGFPGGRSVMVSKPGHTFTEAWYDGAFHYLDVDIRGCLPKQDFTVASLDEAIKDESLWANPHHIQPFFPLFKPLELRAQYAQAEIHYAHRWFTGSHTMDYVLRPGESFTRWWNGQGGRWNHRQEYNKMEWLRKLILTPPVGMKSNHPEFTRWTQGNGLFHYAPKLAAPSQDFPHGVLWAKGIAPGKDGLVLTAETAEVVMPIFTPYVIVPLVGELDKPETESQASVVAGAPEVPIQLYVSLDNGLTWLDAGFLNDDVRSVDLTKLVKGRYGYLLKLECMGQPGDLVLRKLAVDTWVQVAPISLPRLAKGHNELTYAWGDRYGQPTQPMLVWPNCSDEEEFLRVCAEKPKEYDPTRNHQRVKGEVVVKLAAPEGRKIAWLSAGATFGTYTDDKIAQTDCRMAYATAPAGPWQEVYHSQVPAYTDHWRFNYDTDIRLDQPAAAVYVKYSALSDGSGVNVVRAALHLAADANLPNDPAVRIVHGYSSGGKDVEKTIEMAAPGTYTIDCSDEVENTFIRIEKPSK